MKLLLLQYTAGEEWWINPDAIQLCKGSLESGQMDIYLSGGQIVSMSTKTFTNLMEQIEEMEQDQDVSDIE